MRVTLPLVRTAVLGGCVLVMLTVLSEYGAFEILRFQTFTTEIFTEFQFDAAAAGALSVPLVLLGLLVLLAERLVPRRAIATERAAPCPAPARARADDGSRVRSGWAGSSASASACRSARSSTGCAQSQHTTLPAAATLGAATGLTSPTAPRGALIAVVPALPVAMMSFRRRSAARTVLERSTYVTQALPGVVIALSLVFFATRYAFSLYQTSRCWCGLRDHALPARAGLRQDLGGPGPAAPDRRRALAGPRAGGGVRARHPAAARARAARRLLPGVPHRGRPS